jgi:flagellar basal body-associated protein FliL
MSKSVSSYIHWIFGISFLILTIAVFSFVIYFTLHPSNKQGAQSHCKVPIVENEGSIQCNVVFFDATNIVPVTVCNKSIVYFCPPDQVK